MKYLLILLIGEAVAMSVVALLHLVTALGGIEFPLFAYPLIAIGLFIAWLIVVLEVIVGNWFR